MVVKCSNLVIEWDDSCSMTQFRIDLVVEKRRYFCSYGISSIEQHRVLQTKVGKGEYGLNPPEQYDMILILVQ